MHRFFVDASAIQNNKAAVTGEDVAHIKKVLRLSAGDEIIVSDGQCYEYIAKIEEVSTNEVLLHLEGKRKCVTEPEVKVSLFQGLPKAGKMELIVQKCVELGVHSIVPVDMARSVVKVGKDYEKKLVRYRRVALEAAKQSRRGIVPEVKKLCSINEIDVSAFDAVIVGYEEENKRTLKQALNSCADAKNIAIVIGPEGGFEKSEIESLKERGALCITLGARILRTETAGMAMLAMVLYDREEAQWENELPYLPLDAK